MLSIEVCKNILKENGLRFDDSQVKEVREYLYAVANIATLRCKYYSKDSPPKQHDYFYLIRKYGIIDLKECLYYVSRIPQENLNIHLD